MLHSFILICVVQQLEFRHATRFKQKAFFNYLLFIYYSLASSTFFCSKEMYLISSAQMNEVFLIEMFCLNN